MRTALAIAGAVFIILVAIVGVVAAMSDPYNDGQV